jgi:hypothetical protein
VLAFAPFRTIKRITAIKAPLQSTTSEYDSEKGPYDDFHIEYLFFLEAKLSTKGLLNLTNNYNRLIRLASTANSHMRQSQAKLVDGESSFQNT